jgi:hypothetical protein
MKKNLSIHIENNRTNNKNNANIASISTDDVRPKNKNDERCAPSSEFQFGSCIKLKILVEMAKAFNEMYKNNIIELDDKIETLNPQKYKKYLLKEFNTKLKQKCTTQKCWSEQKFIQNMKATYRDELEKYTWRPSGPDIGRKWLNTVNIDEVLTQYEKSNEDFKYLGTMPRDFQDHDFLKQDEKFYDDLLKSGKFKVGMVYNTDKYGGNGEHWNAMFANFLTGEIYFFDSYGVPPEEETRKHMRLLERIIQSKCDSTIANYNKKNIIKDEILSCKKITMDENDQRHQYKGSECGVYSISFIVRMLEGEKFEDVCDSKVPDDIVNKLRKVFYRGD